MEDLSPLKLNMKKDQSCLYVLYIIINNNKKRGPWYDGLVFFDRYLLN